MDGSLQWNRTTNPAVLPFVSWHSSVMRSIHSTTSGTSAVVISAPAQGWAQLNPGLGPCSLGQAVLIYPSFIYIWLLSFPFNVTLSVHCQSQNPYFYTQFMCILESFFSLIFSSCELQVGFSQAVILHPSSSTCPGFHFLSSSPSLSALESWSELLRHTRSVN